MGMAEREWRERSKDASGWNIERMTHENTMMAEKDQKNATMAQITSFPPTGHPASSPLCLSVAF
jgi:hypothetical protein